MENESAGGEAGSSSLHVNYVFVRHDLGGDRIPHRSVQSQDLLDALLRDHGARVAEDGAGNRIAYDKKRFNNRNNNIIIIINQNNERDVIELPQLFSKLLNEN